MRLIKKLILLLVLLLLLFGSWSLYSYGVRIDRRPWQWSGKEWSGWWRYTVSLGRQVGEDVVKTGKKVGQKVVEEIQEIDWAKLGDRITSKTKELFGRSEETVQRIQEHRTVQQGGGYAPKYPGEAGKKYDYGLQWLDKGIREWRVSLVHENATARAKKYFERAVASFEEAKKLDPNLPLLETFLEQARNYLADSTERLEKIEELRQALERQRQEGGE